MKWIRTIFREIFGLFVDDSSFALAVLIWLGLVRLASPHLAIPPAVYCVILFAGLALILIESTTRYARRKHPETKK